MNGDAADVHFAALAARAIELRCRERCAEEGLDPDKEVTENSYDFAAVAPGGEVEVEPTETVKYRQWRAYEKQERGVFRSALAYLPVMMSILTHDMQRAQGEADAAMAEAAKE